MISIQSMSEPKSNGDMAPLMDPLGRPADDGPADDEESGLRYSEDTPAYHVLRENNLLCKKYRVDHFGGVFTAKDFVPNTNAKKNLTLKFVPLCLALVVSLGVVPLYPDAFLNVFLVFVALAIILFCAYNAAHSEFIVPAGHVALLTDSESRYLFAAPGMHNLISFFIKRHKTERFPVNGFLGHGNRGILVIEQGYIGLGSDSGQPLLFPPGIHVWESETVMFERQIALDETAIKLGPYTLLTVDEGYAAVTQNNGRQHILQGGRTHLLNHKNWRFEKFMTLKVQTDNLEEIKATSADNITMVVTSTVNWRIVDPYLAATMAAETMNVGKGVSQQDIPKIRADVLKQAIASLASFIGGVNYSDSFHMAAKAAATGPASDALMPREPEPEGRGQDNPIYDTVRMKTAMEHANDVTQTYGVHIVSINILSAIPIDATLTQALASGAVAAAEALQAETAARGRAKATRIEAEAEAEKVKIEFESTSQAAVTKARGEAEASRLVARGNKDAADMLSTSQIAVDLAKMSKSAEALNKQDKFFFGQEPAYLANLVLKDGPAARPGVFG